MERKWKTILNNKKLIITTDKGTTSIDFENEYYTIQNVIDEINSYYPDGISICSKDSKERVLLTSETKGVEAFISVNGNAAPLIFGIVETAKGSNANAGTIDYSKFFKAVRTYTGDPLIPMEVTDEQMKLFLKEALAYYKRYKGDEINQYTCQLKGDWQNGYEIPTVIESQRDIVDIIFNCICSSWI